MRQSCDDKKDSSYQVYLQFISIEFIYASNDAPIKTIVNIISWTTTITNRNKTEGSARDIAMNNSCVIGLCFLTRDGSQDNAWTAEVKVIARITIHTKSTFSFYKVLESTLLGVRKLHYGIAQSNCFQTSSMRKNTKYWSPMSRDLTLNLWGCIFALYSLIFDLWKVLP